MAESVELNREWMQAHFINEKKNEKRLTTQRNLNHA